MASSHKTTVAIVLASVALAGAIAAGIAVIVTRPPTGQQDRQVAQLQRQVRGLQATLSTDQAKLAGQHRDLITCADLQVLINDMPQGDSAGDTVFYGGPAGSLPLPAHCLNQ
jgi:hypothetical protein